MMLPPAMVSMPFKLMIFMLSGGWNLVTRTIMQSFEDYFNFIAGRGGWRQMLTDQVVLDMLREAFTVALRLALPLLLTSLGVGLIVSVIQAATQIQEQTLTFVPKVILIGLMLVMLASWMIRFLTEYIRSLFERILTFM
jgi:flagellar biosynthetic protein FliQ